MSRIYEHTPLALLLSYLILCGFRSPQLADSLIILCLSALFAARMYFNYKPRKDITTQLNEQKLAIYAEMSGIRQELLDHIGKMSFGARPNLKSDAQKPAPIPYKF